jgi:membrane protease subunit (stomatin/prohibitin family)
MGLFDKLKGELIDIIEWLDPTNDTMVYRFERKDNEIKNGAKLTVRESQVAVFVNEGQIADVFGPGMYTLATQNLPLLSTLKGWKYGFNSPFKAEVYFMNTKQFTDQKWGTPNPVMMRDADFGVVRIRAFGSYAIRIIDPVKFLKEIVGTKDEFSTEDITSQLKNMIITRFTDAIGEAKIPVLDLASSYNELSEFVGKKLAPEFQEYGVDMAKFLISNISLPKEVEEAIDKKSSMGMLGVNYMQMSQADAMKNASQNPAGGGVEGMMGMVMAQQMMNMQQQQQQVNQPQQNVPPPMPPMVKFFVSLNGQQSGPFDLNTLKQMIIQNQMNQQTFVWREGMPAWASAGQVPEVAALFSAVPPPPPPPMP